MKKFVWILLALCLALGAAVVYFSSGRNGAEEDALPSAAVVEEQNASDAAESALETADGEESAIAVRVLDFDAIRALHAPEDVVAQVDGRDVTWEEYFYWLYDMGSQAENYIQTMAYYGQELNWTDKLEADSEQTLAEYVVELTHDNIRQLAAVEAAAEEAGVSLSEEDEAELAAALQEDIAAACGEGATEDDFNAYLEENKISRAMYDRISRANYLYRNTYIELYGENGEKVSEEDALAYLKDNGYLCATHILFLTLDPATYEALDEETIQSKCRQAEAVSAELRAIEDEEARAARFAELKEQYCEDSGKADFPDGYLFTAGEMVEEFEKGTKALEAYEVSEPVLSAWGYHVIMRLPLDADMTIQYSDAGTPLTARSVFADAQYTEMLGARIEESTVTLKDAAIDLTQYLVEG